MTKISKLNRVSVKQSLFDYLIDRTNGVLYDILYHRLNFDFFQFYLHTKTFIFIQIQIDYLNIFFEKKKNKENREI